MGKARGGADCSSGDGVTSSSPHLLSRKSVVRMWLRVADPKQF
jgi:hypothetical protein